MVSGKIIEYQGGHIACWPAGERSGSGVFIKEGKIVALVDFQSNAYSADTITQRSFLKKPLEADKFIAFLSEANATYCTDFERGERLYGEVGMADAERLAQKHGFRLSQHFDDSHYFIAPGFSSFGTPSDEQIHQLQEVASLQGVELPIKEVLEIKPGKDKEKGKGA